jgi:hypothetical protein
MSAEIVREMMSRHRLKDPDGAVSALREVLQEIVLYGLHEAKFFDSAVFYGGTALRILHGLDRFSEDLDFSLRPGVEAFSFGEFMETVVAALGRFEIESTFRVRDEEISPGGILDPHGSRRPDSFGGGSRRPEGDCPDDAGQSADPDQVGGGYGCGKGV